MGMQTKTRTKTKKTIRETKVVRVVKTKTDALV